jgi:D-threonate/D-erythronate kinase
MAAGLRIAIVADDLTGAMDAAAPFAARGAATRVLIGDECDPASAATDIASITTDSRHLAPEAAARLTAQAVAGLLQSGERLIFKKIDSTLRGNVVAETIAALMASGKRHALVCPAFPGQGRTMIGGEVFVHGLRLSEIAIGRDALAPPPLQPVHQVFQHAAPDLKVHHIGVDQTLAIDAAPGPHVYVIDAAQAEDVARLAAWICEHRQEMIAVGSSGLAAAIAETAFGAVKTPQLKAQKGMLLCVVGSRTPQTSAQMAYLAAKGAHKTELLGRAGMLDGFAFARPESHKSEMPQAMILTVRQLDATPLDPKQVAHALAELARKTLNEQNVGAVVVTGGDTARALFDALGVAAVDLVGELLPGIALGTIQARGTAIPIVTKAGGFGTADLFATIEAKLIRK